MCNERIITRRPGYQHLLVFFLDCQAELDYSSSSPGRSILDGLTSQPGLLALAQSWISDRSQNMAPNPKGMGGVEVATPLPVDFLSRPQSLTRSTKNYKSEKERLESFAGFRSGTVDVRQLAKAGFFYTKCDDIVRCAFCNVEVGQWEEGDDPMEEHKKWSKNCAFLNNLEVGNIPVDPANPPPLPPLEVVGFDECGLYNIRKTDNCPIIPSLEKLGIHKRYTPAHPAYATEQARLESFGSWPVGLKLRPKELAEAGFFYTGLGDKTICFQCGGGLKDWAETDEPWREHALYFSKCGFVVQTKGREFISEVLGKKPATLTPEEIEALTNLPKDFSNIVYHKQSESVAAASSSEAVATNPAPEPSCSSVQEKVTSESTEETKKTQEATSNSSTSKRLDDARACKICFSEEIGVAFLPCGHLVSCINCVSSLTTCAVCRKPFSATVRVFLS